MTRLEATLKTLKINSPPIEYLISFGIQNNSPAMGRGLHRHTVLFQIISVTTNSTVYKMECKYRLN